MPRSHAPLAIAYDFDGTLAPGNMQERDFIPSIGMTTKEFWKEVADQAKKHNADNILVYMKLMLDKAQGAQVPVHEDNFRKLGKDLQLFQGVEEWFDRIDAYGRERQVKVEHFVISSGVREMVEGTKIASKFKKIYASSFIYDHNGVARWPALVLNYTTKTQYLFRINKGALDVFDNKTINDFILHSNRAVPFTNMAFIGDGDTDIPCFRVVKDQGGHSIAVYKPSTRGARTRPEKLLKEGRVNFMAPADYRDGKRVDQLVKGIIDKVAADSALCAMRKEDEA